MSLKKGDRVAMLCNIDEARKGNLGVVTHYTSDWIDIQIIRTNYFISVRPHEIRKLSPLELLAECAE